MHIACTSKMCNVSMIISLHAACLQANVPALWLRPELTVAGTGCCSTLSRCATCSAHPACNWAKSSNELAPFLSTRFLCLSFLLPAHMLASSLCLQVISWRGIPCHTRPVSRHLSSTSCPSSRDCVCCVAPAAAVIRAICQEGWRQSSSAGACGLARWPLPHACGIITLDDA